MPDLPATPPESDRTDRRGAPPGRFGNAPFIPTDEQRQQVRNYAKVFPVQSQHLIARLIGVSRSTLHDHFADDIELGRAELIAAAGTQMINMALKGREALHPTTGEPLSPGDLDALKYLLARQGGWSTKVEMSGPQGRPIEYADLTKLSSEQLEEYGRLAAAAAGLDPEEVVGRSED